jgi:hypothetical protein
MKKLVGNKLFLLMFAIILMNINFISCQEYFLKVTEEHPFLVGGKWLVASELKVGDSLTTADGKKAKITEIEAVALDELVNVYNLEALPFNDFVVDGEVVVHNSNKRWTSEDNIKVGLGISMINNLKNPLTRPKNVEQSQMITDWVNFCDLLKQEDIPLTSIVWPGDGFRERSKLLVILFKCFPDVDSPLWIYMGENPGFGLFISRYVPKKQIIKAWPFLQNPESFRKNPEPEAKNKQLEEEFKFLQKYLGICK